MQEVQQMHVPANTLTPYHSCDITNALMPSIHKTTVTGHTLSGCRTQPLQAWAMNARVSVSAMSPKAAEGCGFPPTWTTQQLMLAPLMPFTAVCMAVGLENPGMPSVSNTNPLRAFLGRSWMANVPARTIPSKLLSPLLPECCGIGS